MISMRSVDVIGKSLISKFFDFKNENINTKEDNFKSWINSIDILNNTSNAVELECYVKNQTGKIIDSQQLY